ncbi:hypothetical protein QQS21_006808 [Conoideocrella luteorostrata]|uniref:DUF7907 domain-containing protein n=1 Tax=Conoideocrella luteorostrata TaxID=1105319 RepID=A0AAJ0FXY1_9HYPO|nr:hypothetical protein QQS21_006808 [Conoideocrella luteorostrata]
MKPTAILSAIAVGGLVAAQEIQSKPFNLIIQSANKELNGRAFATCHSGAAIESLCLSNSRKEVFHHNTTEGSQPGPGGLAGVLTWTLPSQPPIPSSMRFSIDPSTNVAISVFFPGGEDSQYVGFDKNEQMNIVSYLDDTKSPPTGTTPRELKNWYLCTTYYSSYTYQTLSWVYGNGKPQNPSCVKIDVKRKFV